MMNQPSEDYPKFFPTVIPPPPPPASFFTIPPPPDFSTIVPPTEQPKSNGVLIALVTILAIILVIIALFLLYKWWKKEVKEIQQHVEKHNANRVRSSKNGKKSNVRERDIVYGYDRRLSEPNGRNMEARYGKEPKRNYYYEGDMESGFDDMYLSSGGESNFYLEKLVIDAKDVRKSNAYKGEENTSSKPETTHNGQTKEESAEDAAISNDIELSICDKVDTKSNAYEREEDVHSETETIHDRQSERKLAKDSMRSDAPESDLESALGETGPSKSKHETVRPGKHKKGKGRAG